MKKTGLYIGILIILAFIAWRFYENQKKDSGMDRSDYQFHIEDTSRVAKIIIKDKRPTEITLERSENGWLVNGQYTARKDAIQTLLLTMHRQRMRNFVPANSVKTEIRYMATTGKEVKMMDKDGKVLKHFFVGENTPDNLGTYMMLKGGKLPYAVHIPGFNGFLSTRFFTEVELWRDRTIFGYDNLDISRIQMTHYEDANGTFTLERKKDGSLQVYNEKGEPLETHQVRAGLYVGAFKTLKYEGLIVPSDEVWPKRDSIFASQPIFEIEVETFQGEKAKLTAYHVPAAEGTTDDDGNQRKYSPDHMYAKLWDGRFALIQYFGMSMALRPIDYFRADMPDMWHSH